jgi:hypothetical protein
VIIAVYKQLILLKFCETVGTARSTVRKAVTGTKQMMDRQSESTNRKHRQTQMGGWMDEWDR